VARSRGEPTSIAQHAWRCRYTPVAWVGYGISRRRPVPARRTDAGKRPEPTSPSPSRPGDDGPLHPEAAAAETTFDV
jgi:hypothetical protein